LLLQVAVRARRAGLLLGAVFLCLASQPRRHNILPAFFIMRLEEES